MAAAILLRDDFSGPVLRGLGKATKDAAQARPLLALAEIYDGGSRSDAARIAGVGLVDGKAPGNASKLDDAQRQALADIVERGPIPAIHGVVRWRLANLAPWIWEEFGISLSETTVGRELKALGYVKIRRGPATMPKTSWRSPAELVQIRKRLPAGTEIELWWQDEARVGQTNNITRRWAKRGTRPHAPHDQRTKWTYIFGAICPEKGKAAGLVML